MAPVDRNLLERLNKLASALKVGDELIGGVAPTFQEVVEARFAQRSRAELAREIVAPARETRCDGQTDADRVVHLMRHARDEPAERGELFGSDQILLSFPQILQRGLGALL